MLNMFEMPMPPREHKWIENNKRSGSIKQIANDDAAF